MRWGGCVGGVWSPHGGAERVWASSTWYLCLPRVGGPQAEEVVLAPPQEPAAPAEEGCRREGRACSQSAPVRLVPSTSPSRAARRALAAARRPLYEQHGDEGDAERHPGADPEPIVEGGRAGQVARAGEQQQPNQQRCCARLVGGGAARLGRGAGKGRGGLPEPGLVRRAGLAPCRAQRASGGGRRPPRRRPRLAGRLRGRTGSAERTSSDPCACLRSTTAAATTTTTSPPPGGGTTPARAPRPRRCGSGRGTRCLRTPCAPPPCQST